MVTSVITMLTLLSMTPQVEQHQAVAPHSSHQSVEQWHSTAIEAGWQESQWLHLARIIFRESTGIPTATHHNKGGTWDYGLTQINSIHWSWLANVGITPAMLLTPAYNLRAARLLYERDGWRPWGG